MPDSAMLHLKKRLGEGWSLPFFFVYLGMKEIKNQTTYFKKSQLCHDLYGRQDDFLDVFINAPFIIHNDEILIPITYVLDLFADNIIYENGRTDNGKSLSELFINDPKLDQITL